MPSDFALQSIPPPVLLDTKPCCANLLIRCKVGKGSEISVSTPAKGGFSGLKDEAEGCSHSISAK